MADFSKIEWTDSTWNPVTGCKKISPGCKFCYAEVLAERFRGTKGHPFENGFDVTLRENNLNLPLKWKKPRKVFVNSMSDLFLDSIHLSYVKKVFDVMEEANGHVYQILTKRPQRMVDFIKHRYHNDSVPGHIWLGVSVETADYKWRIQKLKEITSKRLFISFEPLLGMIDFEGNDLAGIAWAIIGGESGHNGRPMNPVWVESIRKATQKSKTKFFFKQWGNYNSEGSRVGKKRAGREYRGRTWDAMPQIGNQIQK
jgi:protein gp37